MSAIIYVYVIMKPSPIVIIGLLGLCPTLVFVISHLVYHHSISLSIFLAFLSTFAVFDTWYFLNMAHHQMRTMWRRGNVVQLFTPNVRYGRVSLNDIDRNGHYNNARYLRECGFGRRDFWQVVCFQPVRKNLLFTPNSKSFLWSEFA